MITIKNKASISKMERAGELLSSIFDELPSVIRSGMSTLELDQWIEKQLAKHDLLSKMKGYMGYAHVSCISLNDVVVHGVPSAHAILADGDLVKVDVCVSWNGYCADMARSFFVGVASENARKLVAVAQAALDKGIEAARSGNHLSDISAAIQKEVESHGFSVIRDFAGHGIGKRMHEDPEIVNYGKPGRGPVLRPGMAFALEPMIAAGKYDVYVGNDGWTVKTKDKSLAAHVEDTIVVTDGASKVITRRLYESQA